MPKASTHTVKAGDTLGKIAAKHGTTVAAIAQANGIKNVNSIRVGQVLKIPGETPAPAAPSPAPTPAPTATPKPTPAAAPAKGHVLGTLSARFETSGRGPGTVSGGVGDPGGVSYGSYQLASKLKRPAEFLAREGARWAPEFAGTTQGTPAFSAVWKKIAKREPEAFHEAQHAYIQRTHYDPQCAKVKAATGVDLDKRGDAVRDATWSTAVQHGPGADVIIKAIGGRQLDDRALLEAIYAERGRLSPNGKLARFPRASAAVQRGVAQRFKDELKAALAMLKKAVGAGGS